MNTSITKNVALWDLVIQKLALFPMSYCISILSSQMVMIYAYQFQTLPLKNHGYLFIYSLIGVLFQAVFGYIAHQLITKRSFTDYTFAIDSAMQQFSAKYSSDNTDTMSQWKLIWLSALNLLYFFNVILLLPFIYFLFNQSPYIRALFDSLYGKSITKFSDPRLLIFILLQLLQVIILVYINYRKTNDLISKGFGEIVNEVYNSTEAQKYPHYSRFWLYAIPIIVFTLWIFIHPLSLLLIQLLN